MGHVDYTLEHDGKPMRWAPTRLFPVKEGRPLLDQTPVTPVDLSRLLRLGYGFVVQLEPGDATRYTVLLAPAPNGFGVMHLQDKPTDPVHVRWGYSPPPSAFLGSGNPWTTSFLSWWCHVLSSSVA